VADDQDLPIDANACTDDVCTSGVASNPPLAAGSACAAGLVCDGAGVCWGCVAATDCPGLDSTCRTRTCGAGVCGFASAPDTTGCDDGDANTVDDQCTSGVCVGVDHCVGVTCAALDACHNVGTCDHATGVCSSPSKLEGDGCDDDDANTVGDQCTGGVCAGVDYCIGVTCLALDQCHEVGACDHATGVCSDPNSTNGTTCNDGNANTTGDACTGGVCAGIDHCIGVTCAALDDCHDIGSCDHASGTCSDPIKTDGYGCDDANANTVGDLCTNGICAGIDYCVGITCAALDDCHEVGTCDHATGTCSNPIKTDGSGCDDADANTVGDQCTGGICAGIDHCIGVTCAALDDCHDIGSCDHAAGMCSNPIKTDGFGCDDANANTVGDQCTGGVCAGTDHCIGVTCAALDDCHDIGSCDHATGICSDPIKIDGSGCSDANACTSDSCQGGSCNGVALPAGTSCGGGDLCDGFGVCLTAPSVVATTPADGGSAVASSAITVTFSEAITPATLTAQTAVGVCSGSIQVSLNDFATCTGFALSTPTLSGGNTVARLTPAPGLLINRTYKVRVTTAATAANTVPLAATYTGALGFATSDPLQSVVLSQVYGGGGNASAPYSNDFIELHNRGTAAVSLAGWSVQYASAASATWAATALSGSLLPGAYYLVQESSGGAVGAPLPTPDATDALVLAATAGKVALVTSTTLLVGTCPSGATILDLVGYGTTANCFETARATAPSNTTAVVRSSAGCSDTDNNATDFAAATPVARNSGSPEVQCGAAQNESNNPSEVKYCVTQYPLSITGITAGTSLQIFGQMWDGRYGHNDSAITAQLGFGPPAVNPEYQSGWTWVSAPYDSLQGANDQYLATFNAPLAGTYAYAYRISLDGGATWTYCDNAQGDFGAGANPGLSFDFENEGILIPL